MKCGAYWRYGLVGQYKKTNALQFLPDQSDSTSCDIQPNDSLNQRKMSPKLFFSFE